MAPRFWTKTFRQYLLLQLPDIVAAAIVLVALHRWVGLPLWAAVGLFLLWVAKDIVPYPWFRDALERRATTGQEALVGARAVAVEALDPVGYVRMNGELWRAEAVGPGAVAPGTEVVVLGVRGLTLRVAAEEGGSPSAAAGL